jgi:hypothetical protein
MLILNFVRLNMKITGRKITMLEQRRRLMEAENVLRKLNDEVEAKSTKSTPQAAEDRPSPVEDRHSPDAEDRHSPESETPPFLNDASASDLSDQELDFDREVTDFDDFLFDSSVEEEAEVQHRSPPTIEGGFQDQAEADWIVIKALPWLPGSIPCRWAPTDRPISWSEGGRTT